jgi:phospholipid/cholesterol/gamma-HCH transport system substrate-binding protein
LQTTDGMLNREGPALAAEMRQTLASARSAAASLEASLANVEPLTRQLNQDTLPAATATLRDLRQTSANLRAMTERLEAEGAGSLLGAPPLPEYEPQ